MASSPSTSLLLRQMRAHHAAAPSSPAASAAAAAPLQAASAAAVVSPLPMTPTMATSSSPCPLPPGRRPRHQNQSGGLGGGSAGPSTPLAAATTQQQQQQQQAPTPATSRFPVRVFLSAYMMRSHPEVVFSSIGPDEAALAQAATAMLATFESACAAFSSSSSSSTGEATPSSNSNIPTRRRLERLDDAWAEYHALFRAWRLGDAAQLEREIVEMACRLEVSMLRKVGAGPASPLYEARLAASPDLQSLVRQVQGDRQLLRARLARVSGRGGVARMDAALEEARAAVGAEMEQQQAIAMAAGGNGGSEQQQR
jgi:hypothetical protein